MSSVATIAVVASVGSAMVQSNAAKQAAKGQSAAANAANQMSAAQTEQQRRDSAPWRVAGDHAISQLSYLLGLSRPEEMTKTQYNFDANAYLKANPDAQEWIANNQKEGRYLTAWDHYVADGSKREGNFWKADSNAPGQGGTSNLGEFGSLNRDFSMADFQQDPGYQFRYDEGQKALERSAASKGRFLGGGTLKALTRYGQDMGSQEYNNAYTRFQTNRNTRFNQLASIAGLGQTANAQQAQLGQISVTNQGNNLMGAANASGAAGIAGANAWGTALNNGANTWTSLLLAKK